jgi:uncharacterized membrane protein YdfJ with MMPL/SSD domain
MRQLTRLILRRPWLVIAFWVVLLLASAPNVGTATRALSQSFTVPGRVLVECEVHVRA